MVAKDDLGMENTEMTTAMAASKVKATEECSVWWAAAASRSGVL